MASKMVRPGQVYRVSVTVFQTPFPITVRASIQRDGIELASTSQELKQNIPETLLIKVMIFCLFVCLYTIIVYKISNEQWKSFCYKRPVHILAIVWLFEMPKLV